jgi:hypothetical protein
MASSLLLLTYHVFPASPPPITVTFSTPTGVLATLRLLFAKIRVSEVLGDVSTVTYLLSSPRKTNAASCPDYSGLLTMRPELRLSHPATRFSFLISFDGDMVFGYSGI